MSFLLRTESSDFSLDTAITIEELQALELEVEKIIEEAVEFGMNSPEPSLDILEEDIYAD